MTDLVAPPSGYAAHRKRSPGALAAAIAINGGVFALLLAWPATQYIVDHGPKIDTRWIPLDPVPPENPPEPPPPEHNPIQPVQDTVIPDTKPFVITPILPVVGPTIDGSDIVAPFVKEPVKPVLTVEPVFKAARQDPRYADSFRPDYPPSMRREGVEGTVVVRVSIDEKGRVTAVDLVRASDNAFFEQTRRQALRYWRFLPATRDGVAVASEQTLTLRFQLED